MSPYVKPLLVILLILAIKCDAQQPQVLLNHTINALKAAYKQQSDTTDLNPVAVMFINGSILEPQNNIITAEIRKLLLSKKYKNSNQILEWLIPAANKVALQEHFIIKCPLIDKYKDFFDRNTKAICPCLEKMKTADTVLYDINVQKCMIHYWQDRSLMNEYISAFKSLPDQEKADFLRAAYYYANTGCSVLFNSLIRLSVSEISADYSKRMDYYKQTILGYLLDYNYRNSDSLKIVFPGYINYSSDLAFIKKASKESDNDLKYPLEMLMANNQMERYNSFLFNKKDKLVGQLVYEVGIDKPLFYIRSVKFYPRQTIQNVEKLESDLLKMETVN